MSRNDAHGSRRYPDDDLAAMYLSDKKNGVPRNPDDHEELEVLLESFAKQVEEIVNEAENIQVSGVTSILHLQGFSDTVAGARTSVVAHGSWS